MQKRKENTNSSTNTYNFITLLKSFTGAAIESVSLR